jgi:hypothetical protein
MTTIQSRWDHRLSDRGIRYQVVRQMLIAVLAPEPD